MKTNKKSELLFHPVRIRILGALAGGKKATPFEIGQWLSDVPPATLYRQINALLEAGVLTVTELRPNRGTLEKVLTIDHQRSELSADALKNMSRTELMQLMTNYLASVISNYDRYLSQPTVDLHADLVSIRQSALWLSDDESRELISKLKDLVSPYFENRQTPARKQRTLSTIFIPDPIAKNTK